MTNRADVNTGFAKADLLLILPFIWQLGLAPWANEVAWRPFGLPFMMAWQMAGILFTTLVLAWRYVLTDPEEPAGGDASGEGDEA